MIRAIDRTTDKLTLAGLLMFGKIQDIMDTLPNYFLDYREVNDVTTERWSHRITSSPDEGWNGSLWGFFNKIVNRLTSDIEVPFALDKDMMRIADTDVHKSVREGLANSLVHTDYSSSGSIVIEKGYDYFKFSNPGNLRVPADIAMAGGRSDPRNGILHQMFSHLGFGERAGSGLFMISSVWKNKNWIKPELKD